ncbi:MAG: DUF6746 family protein [Halofilum sp. (in: g-proteobacteria)]|nr:DUF6746 family protein [Halofilum sp. (in: g-proteobacteria)]
MRKFLTGAALAAGTLLFSATVPASEVEHYQGKEAKTLEEAVGNLREYNEKLQALIEQEELTAGELEQVHQLTYTLENALKRINTELSGIAGDLETVHLASERREADTVREKGRAYLEQVDTLID